MNLNELRQKNPEELGQELLRLGREKFDLRMQKANGQLKRNHLLKQVRRNIAKVFTLLRERGN